MIPVLLLIVLTVKIKLYIWFPSQWKKMATGLTWRPTVPHCPKVDILVLFTAVSSDTSCFSLTCFSVCELSPIVLSFWGKEEGEGGEEGGGEGKEKKKKGQAKNTVDGFLLSLGKKA